MSDPLTVHNFSNYKLSATDYTLLNKGLSFAPTPSFTNKDHIQLLKSFDLFALSSTIACKKSTSNQTAANTSRPISHNVIKPLKFVNPPKISRIPQTSGNHKLDNYLAQKKFELNNELPNIFIVTSNNISKSERNSILKLKNAKNHLTIKPADKNLGIVLMNTKDYVQQCLQHLKTPTYSLTSEFPSRLKSALENILLNFKDDLINNIIKGRSLYNHLQPTTKHSIPQFYGLPKVHKQFEQIPPIRPIVAHSSSLLSTTAKFLDFALQPIATSYPDYLHNSSDLLRTLEETTIPKNCILVTMDVISLFPSIPQEECLKILQNELQSHNDLLLFNPNLIMHLVSLHLYNNYFEFASFTFHQRTGIAMSVLLRKFLNTQKNKPILIRRYIDDIFILWPHNHNLNEFTTAINNFHPNIQFTTTSSQAKVNFLDLTIILNHNIANSAQHCCRRMYQIR